MLMPWQWAVLWTVLMTAALTPVRADDLPYYPPQPEPKPCAVYWDSEAQRKGAASHPDVVAYLASPTEVIAKLKDGRGLMVFASPRGCLAFRWIDPLDVERLFAGKQGGA